MVKQTVAREERPGRGGMSRNGLIPCSGADPPDAYAETICGMDAIIRNWLR